MRTIPKLIGQTVLKLKQIVVGVQETIATIQDTIAGLPTMETLDDYATTDSLTAYPTKVGLAAAGGAATIGTQQTGANAAVRPVQEKLQEFLNVKDFETGAGDTAAVQAAINEAMVRNLPIRVDRQYLCPTALTNRSKVLFIGEGSLSGDGAYRRRPSGSRESSAPPKFNNLIPSRHLKLFSGMVNPKVVLVGSSTGSWQPNTIDGVSSLPHLLSTRLAKFNPTKQISFFNRAIGGQTFDTLNGIPTNFPAWYTNQSRAWLEYVKDVAPDVVFIVMGSNDQANISQTNLISVVNKIKAFPKVPNIVFITQPSVCLDPDPAFASFGTKADQEGRDFAAGLVRSFAQYEGYGLMDANRMGGIVLDGRDLLDTAARCIVSYQNLPTGEYFPTVPGHDFSMRLRFNGDAAAIIAAFPLSSSSPAPVSIRIGAGGGGGPWSGDVMFIMRDAGGKFKFELYSRGIGLYQTINTTVDFPAASFSLDIAKVGSDITVSVSGSDDTIRMNFPVKVHGGEFLPRVGHYGLSSGPFAQVEFYNVGEPRKYVPAMTGIEAWGTPNAGATTSLPYGGNGVNHFSSVGTRAIYAPLINEESLTAAFADSGRYLPTFANPSNLAAYSTTAECLWTRAGNIVTVCGKLSVTATAVGLVTLDISLPIPTDIKNSDGVFGMVNATVIAGMTGAFFGSDVADMARMQLNATTTAAQNVRFYFTYELQA